VAPFGSAIAVSAHAVVNVVVAEHDNHGDSRLVLVRSPDGGTTLEDPVVIDSGTDTPESITGLGGFIAPIPGVAAAEDGRVAVAWNTGRPDGAATTVFEASSGGAWQPLALPDEGVTTLFPSLAYDGSGRLWLLVGRAGDGTLDYELRSRGTAWSDATRLGGGPASAFIEIGESLGLVSTATSVVAAFPVDSASASSLEVAAAPVAPPVRPTTASVQPPTSQGRVASTPRKGKRLMPYMLAAGVMAVLGAAGAGTFLLRRSRHR